MMSNIKNVKKRRRRKLCNRKSKRKQGREAGPSLNGTQVYLSVSSTCQLVISSLGSKRIRSHHCPVSFRKQASKPL